MSATSPFPEYRAKHDPDGHRRKIDPGYQSQPFLSDQRIFFQFHLGLLFPDIRQQILLPIVQSHVQRILEFERCSSPSIQRLFLRDWRESPFLRQLHIWDQ
jgi:hypothetical protein